MRRSVLTIWGPFLAALAVMFWLSSLPYIPMTKHVSDKFLHAVGYTGLSVLALRAFHGGFRRLRWTPTMCAGLAITLWGASDEFHQSFVPGRDASGWDLLADVFGFAIAAVAVALWTRSRALR